MDRVEECLLYKNGEERDVIKQFFTKPAAVDRSKKTIIFSTPSETGTSYFRLFEPMRVMWKHYRDEANFIYTETIQPNHLRLADAIIMHRAGNLHSHFLTVREMWPRSEVKPMIIHDVDDNEFNLPRAHPMREMWYAANKDKMSIQALKQSDLVVTTTEKLRKTFSHLNRNVEIRRNMFDWELPQWNLDIEAVRKEMLPEWYPTDDKIVVGWAGLTSHFEDIKRMHNVLKAIHDKYPNTVFVLAGMAVKDSAVEVDYDENGKPLFKNKEIENEDMLYRNRVRKLYEDFDSDRIKLFDAVPLEEYGKFYALFDVSLAYVEHNTFNSCKSEIKVVESIHYNCIPVFSYFGGYKDYWDQVPRDVKQDNMAVSSMIPKKWTTAVDYWVSKLNEEMKKGTKPIIAKEAIMQDLKAHTDSEYDLNENIGDWMFELINKIEEHEEAEINRLASEFDSFDRIKM